MIVSVSRRTDVPAFYADWFYNRLKAGYLYTVNPYNPAQKKRVELAPGLVDGIVFWTKDVTPMLPRLNELEAYPYYFTMTINGYDAALEPAFAPRHTEILDGMKRLAEKTSPRRVRWRYNPILLGGGFTPAWHAENFARMAKALDGAAQRCVVSFYDSYIHTERAAALHGYRPATAAEKRETARLLGAEAKRAGIRLVGCSEVLDLGEYGIQNAPCIDAALLSEIAGRPIAAKRDRGQRESCLCAASVDVGAYNTCPGGCTYCYARRSVAATLQRYAAFDSGADCLA